MYPQYQDLVGYVVIICLGLTLYRAVTHWNRFSVSLVLGATFVWVLQLVFSEYSGRSALPVIGIGILAVVGLDFIVQQFLFEIVLNRWRHHSAAEIDARIKALSK